MRENPVKKKLREGRVTIGTMMFEFNTTGIGRIASAAGAEFAIFDMEHTGWSVIATGSLRELPIDAGLRALPLRAWASGRRDRFVALAIKEISGRRLAPGGVRR